MKDFCIIGSGISGSTIANILSKNYSLDVYDKARGIGGRSSNKKLNKNESFDHGVQYISPKSIQFKKFINNLIKKKIVKNWLGKHIFLNTDKKEDKKHVKIIGVKGNNAISKYLLKSINCKCIARGILRFYFPATTIPSINIVGAFVEYLNSRSSAKVIFLNISLKFPAIVISLTGYLNTPFSNMNPVAPTE